MKFLDKMPFGGVVKCFNFVFAQTLQLMMQLIQGETVKYEKCLSYNLINIKLAKLHLLSLRNSLA